MKFFEGVTRIKPFYICLSTISTFVFFLSLSKQLYPRFFPPSLIVLNSTRHDEFATWLNTSSSKHTQTHTIPRSASIKKKIDQDEENTHGQICNLRQWTLNIVANKNGKWKYHMNFLCTGSFTTRKHRTMSSAFPLISSPVYFITKFSKIGKLIYLSYQSVTPLIMLVNQWHLYI